ncbi:MAG TPA: flagellar basal body rod protein FlgC [Syntrophobacteraceae bacterium]|nr:flagellar basal body rod protein FlgC [Syntrophobacteraceae bacterium]
MDFETAMKVSASGLSAQRTWMNVISANLANINTTRTQSGKPFQRQTAIVETAAAADDFDQILGDMVQNELEAVRVAEIVPDGRNFKEVYDPGHPDANPNGIVKMPNISVVEEMANMVMATRSYEANLAALNNAKQMALRATDIGK